MIKDCVKIGNFYKLRYNDKNRVVVILEERESQVLVWDFAVCGYRTFYLDSISDTQDISNHCIKTENINRLFPPPVRTVIHNGILYAVNIAR